jgi:predicted nucleic acid-binding protein
VAVIRSVENIVPQLKQRFILDSNVLIQFLDKQNTFNGIVKSKIDQLFIAGVNFYYPAPALLEIKNHWRLKLLHEAIQYCIDYDIKLFAKFEKHFKDVASKRRSQNKYINDTDVKYLRRLLEEIHDGKGIKRWLELCETALTGKMKAIETTLKKSNIKYTNFSDEEIFLTAEKEHWPKWGTVNNLIEKFALSSNDAAILNMALANRIDGIISNDGDVIFAVRNGAYPSDKLFYTFPK